MLEYIGFMVEEEKRRILDEIISSMFGAGIESFDEEYIEMAAEEEGIYLNKEDYDYLQKAYLKFYPYIFPIKIIISQSYKWE